MPNYPYPYNLLVYPFRPIKTLGRIGIAWAHHRKLPGKLTGSVEGSVEENCDFLRDRGVAAVLSLTDFTIELATLPLDAFSRGVRERHMAWYHLPTHQCEPPGPDFEQAWGVIGSNLRRIVRNGGLVVVHGEGDLARCAMIVARLFVEMGCDPDVPYGLLNEFCPTLYLDASLVRHVYAQQIVADVQPGRSRAAIRERSTGALLGLAVGDAVGASAKSLPRGSFPMLTDMAGGGPLRLRAGEWTDDTALALALAETLQDHDWYNDWPHRESLINKAREAFYAGRQNRLARERLRKRVRQARSGDYEGNGLRFERALAERFTNWMERGAYSCNGRCLDIDTTALTALTRWKQTGHPLASSAIAGSAGAGCLARLAPVVIRYRDDRMLLRDYAARQGRITHGAVEAMDACMSFAELLADAIDGRPPGEVLAPWKTRKSTGIAAVLAGGWRVRPHTAISSDGHVLDSLKAALWCVGRSASFEQAVLMAANLGGQADTLAAITGQLAGAIYGASGIPMHWRKALAWHDRIVSCAEALLPADIRTAQWDENELKRKARPGIDQTT